MPALRRIFSSLFLAFLLASAHAQSLPQPSASVASPNGQIRLMLFDGSVPIASTGRAPGNADQPGLRYAVEFRGKQIIAESKLGMDIVGAPPLGPGMRITGSQAGSADESYTIPVGKTSTVRNHYNSVHADFADAAGRKLSLEVRAFDDGVAFRYSVPEQEGFKQVRIAQELTEFNYPKDSPSYPLILDGYQSSWEDEYQKRLVNGLHPDWVIAMPYLAEVPDVGWVAVTEADIDNYAGMYLRKNKNALGVRADLSPRVDLPGVAVETETPFSSPWRVLMIGDQPGRLIESNIVLNLNPPSKIADTSWIAPASRHGTGGPAKPRPASPSSPA